MSVKPEFNETFARSEKRAFDGQPLRLTDTGIWLPTPLDVITSGVTALTKIGFWTRLGKKPKVLDAGMGDGRLVASLCSAGHELWAYGIESHESLCELAEENLRQLTGQGLPATWRTCQGDYLDPATYPKLGVRLEDIDAFFNYPDGSEHKLAALVAGHAHPGAFLVLLTPDHTLGVQGLTLEEELAVPRSSGAPGFRLTIYRAQYPKTNP